MMSALVLAGGGVTGMAWESGVLAGLEGQVTSVVEGVAPCLDVRARPGRTCPGMDLGRRAVADELAEPRLRHRSPP